MKARKALAGRQCYHCREWVAEGQSHDCWTTTEENLTRELSEDLLEAWERIRETALDLGEQRIYASHKSIMFSRDVCHFFVRPKKKHLEVWFFLGRVVRHPLIRKTAPSSKIKTAHLAYVVHRDQVEPPLTDWLREAYETAEQLRASRRAKA